MKTYFSTAFLLSASLGIFAAATLDEPAQPTSPVLVNLSDGIEDDKFSEGDKLFTLKVGPMMSVKCNGCHGDDQDDIKGGLDMLTREKFLAGGDAYGDEVLVPKHAEKSFVVDAVKWLDPDWEMPPKENDRLSKEQIADLEQWINLGAPWPDAETQAAIRKSESRKRVTKEGMIVDTSGGLSDDWTYRRYQPETIWAFQPVVKPAVPLTTNDKPGNPIDAFIEAKLDAAGFKLSPQAPPEKLLRRISYDLIGLPPTPKEVEEFLTAWVEDSEKAWSNTIDRLLASPHYGERWGQHWLDVARYSDTAGYSNDYERSNMWRYRDYVIRSLNDDKPYDQFVMEQVAGDELADASLRKRISDEKKFNEAREKGDYNQEEAELLVASSFLRMGPWDPAIVKVPQARQIYVDDVLNSVGQTFLSTTMRCFKCHDHKFDPLPTRDYYRMYSIFETTQLAERPAPFLENENQTGFEDSKKQAEELLAFASEKFKALKQKIEKTERKWYADRGLEYVPPKDRDKDLADEDKPPRLAGLDETEKGRHKVRQQDEWIWTRRLERYQPMAQSVYNAPTPGFLNSRKLRMSTKSKKNADTASHIFLGGAVEAPGEEVTPGVLSVVGIPTEEKTDGDPFKLTEELGGRRTGLAQWIAHKDNSLATRSIVNRIWQYHFGKAIAGNPNNFGVKGAAPTHPKLLDWLTDNFVSGGWKMKRLHRLSLTSKTYRQDSTNPSLDDLLTVDPDNNLFAYYPTRRLSAEELRDGMLRVTGELNPTAGGLPIKPEINMEVALQPRMIQFSLAPTYLPSRTPEERNRRSVYAYRVRGLANPFLETFNQPNPNDSCEMRDSASVSPQAFTLLNSDLMTDRSIAFALRLQEDSAELPEQLSRGFELAFGREPSDLENEKMLAYVKEMHSYHEDAYPEEREYPTEITQSLVEEFSGAPFTYIEKLPVFRDYVRDKQASDVGPDTRALADFCLLLFNSNEFVYLY